MNEVSAFICQTLLQSLIAGKIIKEQKITDYVLMNINSHVYHKAIAGKIEKLQ